MVKLIPLSRDVDHYNEALNVFWKNTNQQEATKGWLRENLSSVLLQKLAERSTISEDFNILAVGSGESEIDLVLLKCVTDFLKSRTDAETAARVFYRVIEPYKPALNAFKSSLASWREDNEDGLALGVNFDWVEDTWQHYQDKCQLKPESIKFHLAHFIQICYHVDMEDVLPRCMEDRLAENGVILVIMLSATKDTFADLFTKQFYETGILVQPFSEMGKRNTEQVCAIAKKRGWKHDVYHFEYSINTTAMLSGDESDRDGNPMLDFLTTTVDFRGETEKSSFEKAMKFWQNESKENEKGETFLTGKHGVVVIYKCRARNMPDHSIQCSILY